MTGMSGLEQISISNEKKILIESRHLNREDLSNPKFVWLRLVFTQII